MRLWFAPHDVRSPVSESRTTGPRPFDRLRRLVGPIANPAYTAAVALRNAKFDAGHGVRRLPVPVISVGNLTTGGTGKTPMVAWVARTLLAHGLKPAIAMRGYKPGGDHGPGSDEAEEYRRTLPGVPVVAQPDRYSGVRALLSGPDGAGVQCVVLDDGFQHRQLHRDVDIVLLDATRDPFGDRMLPAGDLREPVESLLRAHAVVVTHAESAEPGEVQRMLERARAVNPRLVVAVAEHRWTELVIVPPPTEADPNPAQQIVPPTWFKNKVVLGLCAIGNPGPFLVMLSQAGAVVRPMILPDHDPYRPATVAAAVRAATEARAEAIAVTEKDWAKLAALPLETWQAPIVRPRLALGLREGEADMRALVIDAARRRGQ